MYLVGNVKIGRDTELRYTQNGKAIATISGVYNYGRKGNDGRKPSQWVDLALWDKQAEALVDYLFKGAVVHVTADDVHVEEYQTKDGSMRSKLVGRVALIGFPPKQTGESTQAAQPSQTLQQAAPAPSNDFDDDIPF